MEALIVFTWVILVFLVPVCLVSVAYYDHETGTPAFKMIVRTVFAIAVHLMISWALLFPMFLVIFAGAHTEPVGNALSGGERLFLASIVFLQAVAGWLLCCLVALRFVGSSIIFRSNNHEIF